MSDEYTSLAMFHYGVTSAIVILGIMGLIYGKQISS